MKALNKQALREAANAANIASWGKWESYKPHKGARGYEVKVGAKAVAQHCLKVDSAFIAAANPATVLALLDELEAKDKSIGFLKDQLAQLANFNPDWDRLEAAIDSLREHMAKLSAAEKRIAELEARTVCLPKLPVLGSNAEWYEGFAAGASGMRNECADAIRAAGIGVKGE
ncbi:ead/Ea22-like family protein [Citrobacter portucalensis]|uniref:ead/Ea22-like family protein n=1 Tax=Citrobacter portucalensis TaxID=1639133 RepID=UPI00140FA36D|nr:ead/Ea22-like family protein [Citrobacter portucalensis]MEB2718180.1 ead/Ea22-like family protein [Citrobacter portucalensis]NHR82773.1 ead/Ea22-like family protein [Citrobacter portucalensis]